MNTRATGLLATGLSLSLAAASHSGGLTIGGFDTSRGGELGLVSGVLLDSWRSAVTDAFPCATLVESDTLSAEFLADIDVLMISSATGGTSVITPLDGAEQLALEQFVLDGGVALLLVDNDTFGGASTDVVNESVIDVFGVDVVGTGLGWAQPLVVTDPGLSPATDGPYGTVTGLDVGWAGWFDVVPRSAAVLGDVVQFGGPGLLEFPPGALGADSGRVVIVSDSTFAVDGFLAAGSNNEAFLLNVLAVAGNCCTGDLNGDGSIDGADLGALLAAWGSAESNADLDDSGDVDGGDLGIMLAAWGPC